MAVNYPAPNVRLDLDAVALHAYAGLDRFGRAVDQRWAGSASSSSFSGAGAYDMDRRPSLPILRPSFVGKLA